jgi:predicted transcriptional regulator
MAPSTSQANGVQRVLNAILTLKLQQRLDEAPKKRVQTMADISSATFPSMLSRMAKKGLIVYGSDSKTVIITAKGESMAEPVKVATTTEEVQDDIKKKLKGKALRIFEFLAEANGEPREKQEIMEAVDCLNPKTFAPLCSRELKKHGLIEYPTKTTIKLSSICFL